MKKILLTMITIAAFGYGTKAQMFGFQQTDVILEGAISVNSTDNKNTEKKSTSFGVTPKVGYFVSDKFAVGLQLGYIGTKNTDYSGSNDSYKKTEGIGAGIFGRYYFLEVGSRLKVYGEAAAGYTTTGGENKVGSTTVKLDKTNSFGINGGVGANFFLTEKVAIGYQFTDVVGFNSSKLNTSGAKASNDFYLNINNFENFFNSGQFSLTFKL